MISRQPFHIFRKAKLTTVTISVTCHEPILQVKAKACGERECAAALQYYAELLSPEETFSWVADWRSADRSLCCGQTITDSVKSLTPVYINAEIALTVHCLFLLIVNGSDLLPGGAAVPPPAGTRLGSTPLIVLVWFGARSTVVSAAWTQVFPRLQNAHFEPGHMWLWVGATADVQPSLRPFLFYDIRSQLMNPSTALRTVARHQIALRLGLFPP